MNHGDAIKILTHLIRQNEDKATWKEQVRFAKAILDSGRTPTLEESLTAFRAARVGGIIAEEDGFAVVAAVLVLIAEDRASRGPALNPDDYDRLVADVFREHGEPEMADLYLNDLREFDRRAVASLFRDEPDMVDLYQNDPKEFDRRLESRSAAGKDNQGRGSC